MWRKGNICALLVGMQTGAATMENSMEFPQKTKNGTALDRKILLLGLYLKNPESPIQKNLCTPMFIAAQFTIANCWKQPQCPSVNSGSKNCGTFTQWIATQQKEKRSSYPFATAWMELESITLSEISQAVKDNTI